jgi:LysM repeat protein
MRTSIPFSLTATILAVISFRSMAAAASTGGDLDQEYAQVRKIALKDPRVQEAFAKANERLDDRILEIDPALKPIVEREQRTPAPVAVERARVVPQPAVPPPAEGRQHIVVKGETLDSIAIHYKVKVATLQKVNHITDVRKLRVGQKLVIPASESAVGQPSAQPASQPAAESQQQSQPKDSGGIWDRVKNSL